MKRHALNRASRLDVTIIISATGFNLSVLGGIEFSVRIWQICSIFSEKVGYRRLLYGGVMDIFVQVGHLRLI